MPKSVIWSDTQRIRLQELSGYQYLDEKFISDKEKNKAFQEYEKLLINTAKTKLTHFYKEKHKPDLCILTEKLAEVLTGAGFMQVVTPTIISKKMLKKMTIDEAHKLYSQVFWLDNKKCLRPMLAPNLYYISKDLLRLCEKPLKLFEIGSCFRKESQGSTHLNEFTMINLVEWGLPEKERKEHLKKMADIIMQTAEIEDYAFESEESVVYGDTADVVCNGIEVASGAMGPHCLDANWGIESTWVGIGFGLERLLMLKNNKKNVKSYSKSITYIDGIRLNI